MCRGRTAAFVEYCGDVFVATLLGGLAGFLLFGELANQLTGHSYWLAGMLAGPFVAFAIIRTLRRV